MECGNSFDEKIDFLIYCFDHAVREGLPFAGKTLKDLFALAGEAAPDGLDDDRVYDFIPAGRIAELVEKAGETLKNPPKPPLRLVHGG